jgi:hypothetical protein
VNSPAHKNATKATAPWRPRNLNAPQKVGEVIMLAMAKRAATNSDDETVKMTAKTLKASCGRTNRQRFVSETRDGT